MACEKTNNALKDFSTQKCWMNYHEPLKKFTTPTPEDDDLQPLEGPDMFFYHFSCKEIGI